MALDKVVSGMRGASYEEIIDNSVSGFLIEKENSIRLAERLSKIWNMSQDELLKIGQNARKKIESLNPQEQPDILEQYYIKHAGAKNDGRIYNMNTINCFFCGSPFTKELFWAREYVLFEVKKYRLVRCNNCHLVFLNPQPTKEELKRFYTREYFCSPEDKFRSSMPSFMILDKVKEATRFKKKGMLLDIGCGPGSFLQRMQRHGWRVHGLDISHIACQLASERVGKDNIFEGDLFSVNLPKGHYDVITLWHLIEHLNDPVKILRRIHALLKDDGLLIVCCPNFGSWLRLIFKDSWYPLQVPYHLFHFTPRMLNQVLQISGYRLKHRKKHFVDPITNMGSLKMSLLRFIGLGRMTGLSSLGGKENEKQSHRPIWWRIVRFGFNAITLILSVVFSLIGNEEIILVYALKNTEER